VSTIQSVAISVALLLAGAPHAAAQTLAVGTALPQLRGETLLGNSLVLPDAAAGKAAFLTIGFSKKGGKNTRAWSERFAKDYGSHANLTSYSVAMLEEAPKILRGFIKAGIKKSVPPQAQSRFLIVTSDEAAWKKYLNVADDDLAYVLLIDGNGRVIWKDQGAFDDKKYEALKAKLAGQANESRSK
jgi:ATP10 protein